jgi:hypothetical protein
MWRIIYKILMGNPVSKRALRRPKSRWRNSTKTDFKETEGYFVDLIRLAQDSNWWRAFVSVLKAVNLRNFRKHNFPDQVRDY